MFDVLSVESLRKELKAFDLFGTNTKISTTYAGDLPVATFTNEFWTSKQRAAHSLHEVSYRACFKPQLPRFFVERLTTPGDIVYDPFSGRGTTALESALLQRVPWACDINPLSNMLLAPRLRPPTVDEVRLRLEKIDLERLEDAWMDLLAFYHPGTLRQITCLRRYLLERTRDGELDNIDAWIRLVALNRLTGHSSGFFSVYSLPPNQAVSVDSQKKINSDRNQVPSLRDIRSIILKKTRSLLGDLTATERDSLHSITESAQLIASDSRSTPELDDGQVALVVTSPPFLDIVNYKADNWLRCWFAGIDPESVPILHFRKLEDWAEAMTQGFREYWRLLRPGGHVAFEVGEVRNGSIKLEETVLDCGIKAGLEPELVLINDQEFTKTSNVWGVANRLKGTNTNRIVLFRKD